VIVLIDRVEVGLGMPDPVRQMIVATGFYEIEPMRSRIIYTMSAMSSRS